MINVFYWKDIAWLTFFDFNTFAGEKKPIAFKKSVFESDWIKLPVEFPDYYSNDKIFETLNIDENPMAEPNGQLWIRENGLHHTSMSVGDIIKDKDGKYFVCMPTGWREIIWCER